MTDLLLQTRSSAASSLVSKTPQPLKIIALGDSLVYGYGDPEGGGWIERLRRRWMMESQISPVLYNLGIRGDRAHQVLQRLEQEFRLRGELRNRVPDRIILSVGINDSARLGRPNGRLYTELETFESQIKTLLNTAQALCPVLFVGMIPVDEEKMPFQDCLYFNHFDQYRYKEVTLRACEEYQVPYLDLFEWWMTQESAWRQSALSPDGLHPNSFGYQAILEKVLSWQPIAHLQAPVEI
jgi:lysophospholipase L1-like esterase